MKIGIPRALLYFRFKPLWETFFEELGLEIVISPQTNNKLIATGIKYAESDICFPMKVAFGHIHYLLDKVDTIFIPRFIRLERKKYVCPKFIGLPDMVRAVFPKAPLILEPVIDLNHQSMESSFFKLKTALNKSNGKIKNAMKLAKKRQSSYETELKQKYKKFLKSPNGLKIGVVGKSYFLEDDSLNGNIFKKLREEKVSVCTSEMVSQEIINKEVGTLKKPLYYSLAKDDLGAALHFLKTNFIRGVIYLISFSCGPDSIILNWLEDMAKECKKPLLIIVRDEHSGREDIFTRVEAFLDLTKNEGYFPPHR